MLFRNQNISFQKKFQYYYVNQISLRVKVSLKLKLTIYGTNFVAVESLSLRFAVAFNTLHRYSSIKYGKNYN